eukprot:9100675-Ditylum_brightwellii.AAC.1
MHGMKDADNVPTAVPAGGSCCSGCAMRGCMITLSTWVHPLVKFNPLGNGEGGPLCIQLRGK